MKWVIEHLQIIIAVAAAIAYMLSRGKELAEPGKGGDGDDAERARQIREEIRRKIAERREGGAEPGTQETPPMLRPQEMPRLDPFGGPDHPARTILRRLEAEQRPEPPPAPLVSHAAMTAVIERQALLAAQMRQLEQARDEQKRRAAELAAAQPAAATAVPMMNRGSLLEDLRDKQGLRRAIFLREVLGPPVALR